MSSRALINSAAAGVAVINALYMVSEVPTGRAAWGWTMAAPASADFTCAEGTVGCGGDTPWVNCQASNFTCTVTPKDHHKCDVATIRLKCEKNGTTPQVNGVDKDPNQFECINNPWNNPNYTKDSELMWTVTPNCTEDHSGHSHGNETTTTATGDVASGAEHVASPLGMGSLLVASMVAKVVV